MDDGTLSRRALVAITLMRIFVGWHFLYEGIAKLTSPSWSAAGYLRQARGPFAGFFRWLASQPNLLGYADYITMWGLTLVGSSSSWVSSRGSRACGNRVRSAVLRLLRPSSATSIQSRPRQLPDRQQEPRRARRAPRHFRDAQRAVRRPRSDPARPLRPAPRLAGLTRPTISAPAHPSTSIERRGEACIGWRANRTGGFPTSSSRSSPAAQAVRRRVRSARDVEDTGRLLRAGEAGRLLMPIEHVTGWLFRVARNRITDLFRKKSRASTKSPFRTRTSSCCSWSCALARCRTGGSVCPQCAAR